MHYIALPFLLECPCFYYYQFFGSLFNSQFLFCSYLQGLFAENKEKLITGAITALLAMEGTVTDEITLSN